MGWIRFCRSVAVGRRTDASWWMVGSIDRSIDRWRINAAHMHTRTHLLLLEWQQGLCPSTIGRSCGSCSSCRCRCCCRTRIPFPLGHAALVATCGWVGGIESSSYPSIIASATSHLSRVPALHSNQANPLKGWVDPGPLDRPAKFS